MASATTVGTLGIQITSSAELAIKSVRSLTSSLKTATRAVNGLSNSFKTLDTVTMSLNRGTTALGKMADSSSKVSKNAKDGASSLKKISDENKKISSTSKESTKSLQTMAGTFNKLGSSIMFAIGFGSLFQSIRTITGAMEKGFSEASDFVENYNLFNVSFGGEVQNALKYQYALNDAFKVNMSESLRYQGFFNNLSKSLGITNEGAMILSTNLTNLTYDLASLYNTDFSSMYSKLQSGMVGQTKPLRSVGIDVTQQTLQPILYEMGIDKYVRDLTQAEKVLLRYIAILRQSESAHGDFARTIEFPANQIRMMKDQLAEMTRWFGTTFIGVFGKILPYLNAVIITLKEIFKWVSLAFGFRVEDYDAIAQQDDALSELQDGLGETEQASESLKKSLMGFDEINLLGSMQTSASGLGSIGLSDTYYKLLESLDSYDNGMGNIKTKAGEISDLILGWLGFTKSVNEATGETIYNFTGIAKISFTPILQSLSGLWDSIRRFTRVSVDLVIQFLNEFVLPISKVVIEETVPRFIKMLSDMIDMFSDIYEGGAKQALHDIYKEVLVPLSKLTLTAINQMLGNLSLIFQDIGKWSRDNPLLAEFISRVVGSLLLIKGLVGLSTILLGVANPLVLIGIAIGAILIYNYDDIKAWWDALNPSTQVLAGMALLAGGIWGVVAAVMGFQSAWTLGLGAVAILAGMTAMTAGIENMKKGIASAIPTIPNTPMPNYNAYGTQPNNNTYNPYNNQPIIQTPPPPVTQPKVVIPTYQVADKSTKYTSVGMYADGGFPATGQMFMARESGAELVGNIGGRTAVMNNQQIVQAVSQGVASAVSQAMGNGGQTVIMQVGDTEFGRVAIKSINKVQKNSNLAIEM